MASEGQKEKQLELLLDQVRKEPTQLNYWNTYKQIQKLDLKSKKVPKEKRVKIALLSSFTIDPLAVYLDIKTRLSGLYPEIYIAPFNQYHQEILDKKSKLYAFGADTIILAIQAKTIVNENFTSEFIKLPNTKQILIDLLNRFKMLISTLIKNTEALILVNNFIIPSFTPLGILDNKTDMGFRDFFYKLNEKIKELYKNSNQVYVVDFEAVTGKHGKSRYINPKLHYRGSFGFSESFLPVITDEYMAYIKASKNLTRKCIVLDLDNMLWGGNIGEDGIEGIKLGNDPPGNAYKDFQRLMLSYYNRGILLAINSKNNSEDALKAIREHPHMLLHEKHFAAIRINWKNKVQNMISLAKEINIGFESLVFLDDNPREREHMKQTLPQVLVVNMPHTPYLYRETLENLNDFNALTLTEEDKKRGEMYYSRKKRENLRESINSLEDFLKSLEMKILIKHPDDQDLPRIERIVNKTNQFNLTTRRYTYAEIKKMKEQKEKFEVYILKVSDKFGDEGIVGVAIIRKQPKLWTLDSFLLSCRVIGRKIETVLLARIITDAKEQCVSTIIGEYVPTKKNTPVKNFYSNHGFKEFLKKEKTYKWKLDLTKQTVNAPKWMKVKNE